MVEPKAVLVIQLRRIGDVILSTPAVAALKKRFPAAAIDYLVEPPGAEALQGNPHLREILVYDGGWGWPLRLRRRRYDWTVDLLGNPRSAFLTALSGAAIKAGPAHVFHRWAYSVRLPQSDAVRYAALEKVRMLAPLGVPAEESDVLPKLYLAERAAPEPLVALAPASRKVTRRWPAASFAALGRLLRERLGARIVVLWGPGEKALAEEVARGIGEGAEPSPPTPTLADAARLLARCRLFVGNCAGPKHIAVALGVPTVTVHASSDPAAWTPRDPRHLFVRREELHCIGCRRNDCPYDLECLRGLAPERVLAACESLWPAGAAR